MAGVPIGRRAVFGVSFAIYAGVVWATALGFADGVPGNVGVLLALAAGPFLLGWLYARPAIAGVVFLLVTATSALPDRTVVETVGNATTYTIHSTDLGPTMFLALIAGVATFAGVVAAQPVTVRRNRSFAALVDTPLGRAALLLAALFVGGPLLVFAVAAGLLLRMFQTRK